jgi:hypothetical protein
MGSAWSLGFGSSKTNTSTTNTQTQKGTVTTTRDFSEAAKQSMIYDLLSASGSGLSDVLSGSNLVGASKASSTTLATQDFMSKVAGTLAATLAGTTQTTDMTTTDTQASVSRNKKIGIGVSGSGS